MTQFNVYQSKKTVANASINDSLRQRKYKDPQSIKTQVLEQYDTYIHLLKTDHVMSELFKKRETLSKQCRVVLYQLQNQTADASEETIRDLHASMNNLDCQHTAACEEFQAYVETKLKWLKTNFDGIYEMIVNREQPPNRETLEHVLSMFCQSESGQITKKEAMTAGIKYTKDQYHLPDDFFDMSKLNQMT